MNDQPSILVATDSPTDATLISELLAAEFVNISTSTDSRCAITDFEAARPAVLILAFNALDKAESYCTNLNQQSELARTLARHTLILCSQKELLHVCALCKQQHFDDYILFWPVTSDPGRLSTTVHRALRQIAESTISNQSALAAQARRLSALESQIAQFTATAQGQLETADQSLERTVRDVGAALDEFSETLSKGGPNHLVEVNDRTALRQEFARLRLEDIDAPLKEAAAAVRPVRQSLNALKLRIGVNPDSGRALKDLATDARPFLLIVDDDEFQHGLLRQLFAGEAYELAFSLSSVEALSVMDKRRPDLILMDIDLPEVDGVETTRLLKTVKRFADIPIVMITGHSEQGVVIASKNAGASDYVVKPFSKATMLTKVRKFLTTDPTVERPAIRSTVVERQ